MHDAIKVLTELTKYLFIGLTWKGNEACYLTRSKWIRVMGTFLVGNLLLRIRSSHCILLLVAGRKVIGVASIIRIMLDYSKRIASTLGKHTLYTNSSSSSVN